MTQNYELMVILKPLLPEDIRSGIEKRLSTLIKNNGGKITETDVWGKRHLAYPINKHDEGYYIVYQIEMPGESVEIIEKELKLFADILRFLVTRADNQ